MFRIETPRPVKNRVDLAWRPVTNQFGEIIYSVIADDGFIIARQSGVSGPLIAKDLTTRPKQ